MKARVSKKYVGACGRRLLDSLVREYRNHKKTKVEQNRVKIDHIMHKTQLENAIKVAPPSTEEYLAGVNIFQDGQLDIKLNGIWH